VSLDLDGVQTLGAAMVVLFLGSFVVGRVGFRNNDILAPVVGRNHRGAFFIDLLNTIVIQGALSLPICGF
jgi:Na+/glutamate symporter